MYDIMKTDKFFGVYLLYCTNPKYKGRTYIGFTVNPKRRLAQHNAGKDHGGAWKTSNRGPWKMVLIVSGFFSMQPALRFEWAWQHPHLSRRLKHVPKKKSRQTVFEYRLMVLNEMLKVGPWSRLPLSVRWLDYEFHKEYSTCVVVRNHLSTCGSITIVKNKKQNPNHDEDEVDKRPMVCKICMEIVVEEEVVKCVQTDCLLIAHLICLAKQFCEDNMILPVKGNCPSCGDSVYWWELIKKKLGWYEEYRLDNGDSSDSAGNYELD